jgi:hypothetical protein
MITDYLNINLLEALELQDLPTDQQEQLATKMSQVAEQRLLVQVYSRLNDDQAERLDKMIDNDSSNGEIYLFLKKQLPEIETMAANILANLKKQLLETYGAVKV